MTARPDDRRAARQIWSLLLRQARRDLSVEDWAGFWDILVLDQARRILPGAALTERLSSLPVTSSGELPPRPPFIAANWRENAPLYGLRYLDGEII